MCNPADAEIDALTVQSHSCSLKSKCHCVHWAYLQKICTEYTQYTERFVCLLGVHESNSGLHLLLERSELHEVECLL